MLEGSQAGGRGGVLVAIVAARSFLLVVIDVAGVVVGAVLGIGIAM